MTTFEWLAAALPRLLPFVGSARRRRAELRALVVDLDLFVARLPEQIAHAHPHWDHEVAAALADEWIDRLAPVLKAAARDPDKELRASAEGLRAHAADVAGIIRNIGAPLDEPRQARLHDSLERLRVRIDLLTLPMHRRRRRRRDPADP